MFDDNDDKAHLRFDTEYIRICFVHLPVYLLRLASYHYMHIICNLNVWLAFMKFKRYQNNRAQGSLTHSLLCHLYHHRYSTTVSLSLWYFSFFFFFCLRINNRFFSTHSFRFQCRFCLNQYWLVCVLLWASCNTKQTHKDCVELSQTENLEIIPILCVFCSVVNSAFAASIILYRHIQIHFRLGLLGLIFMLLFFFFVYLFTVLFFIIFILFFFSLWHKATSYEQTPTALDYMYWILLGEVLAVLAVLLSAI